MDLQQLRKELKEKEKKLKDEQNKKIVHLQFYGMTKSEAYDSVNLEMNLTKRLGLVQQSMILKRGKSDLFWSSNNKGMFLRYFNQKLTIDLRARETFKPIEKPCLIIVNGNKKSKRKEIIQQCQQEILKLLDKKKEDGNEILISIFGFLNSSMISLLSINQDFEKVIHSNLKIYKDENIVKTKNLIQIAVNNADELQQIMNLYKSIKALIELQCKQKFKEIVFQFIRAELEDNKLIRFWDKCNIVQFSNDNDAKQFHLKQCLGQLDKKEHIKCHNCKLTESLQDCFREDYQIEYIGCLITDQNLESQLSVLQFLDPILPIKSKVTQQEGQNTIKEILGSRLEL
ncbi:unnamed protein product [Paramecium octaurelia]|uniref:Uncharacterized protein n=1 Tax=Paramecium octaurelia TaxID=43137 RepID=A0A8S1SB77_PAROT|nr:unnamed protein product [Paramecium octaurelia]